MKKLLITAACVTTCVALLATTADAQKRNRDRDRKETKTCGAEMITATGKPWVMQKSARKSAENAWMRRVKTELGEEWQVVENAIGRDGGKYRCTIVVRGLHRCTVTARPCRVARQK
jgi:hypothetical protein